MRAADGQEWFVEEILTSAVRSEAPVRSLIAWNGSMVRRAWTYPEHWEQLDDDSLLSLMDAAARGRHEAGARRDALRDRSGDGP